MDWGVFGDESWELQLASLEAEKVNAHGTSASAISRLGVFEKGIILIGISDIWSFSFFIELSLISCSRQCADTIAGMLIPKQLGGRNRAHKSSSNCFDMVSLYLTDLFFLWMLMKLGI